MHTLGCPSTEHPVKNAMPNIMNDVTIIATAIFFGFIF